MLIKKSTVVEVDEMFSFLSKNLDHFRQLSKRQHKEILDGFCLESYMTG
jgi:hypothetical protein